MNVIETMDVEMVQQPVRDVAEFSTGRLFYWQVKRELWENKSVWVAPLATAVVALLLWLVGLVQLIRKGHGDSLPADAPIGAVLTGVWSGTAMFQNLTVS